VFVYKGDLSVYRCVDGLHHLDLIAHLVLVWRSDLPDSPLPFNCQPGSGQQMVDCFVKYLRKPPSLPPSQGIRFTDGSASTPSMEAASQTDGR